MPSFPTYGEYASPLNLTFDLLSWISIGIIYSSRSIYLPKFEASGVKRSRVILGTRCWRRTPNLTLIFDLLTGIIISRTIYSPSLKLLGQISVLELLFAVWLHTKIHAIDSKCYFYKYKLMILIHDLFTFTVIRDDKTSCTTCRVGDFKHLSAEDIFKQNLDMSWTKEWLHHDFHFRFDAVYKPLIISMPTCWQRK